MKNFNGALPCGSLPRTRAQSICGGEKRLTVAGEEFVYLYLFGIGVACLGWLAENSVKLITQGTADSRFHMLPFISPYALIPFAYKILFGDADDIAVFGKKIFKNKTLKSKILSNALCFAALCGGAFAGELCVGNMWEKLFGAELWNYGSLPLQVTQYAGLAPSLGYGAGAYLVLRLTYKPVLGFIKKKVDFYTAKTVCCTLGVLIVLDTLFTVISIIAFHRPPVYWQIKLR